MDLYSEPPQPRSLWRHLGLACALMLLLPTWLLRLAVHPLPLGVAWLLAGRTRTARRFRQLCLARIALGVGWLKVATGPSLAYPRSELSLALALMGGVYFLRSVEWRTRRNRLFTAEFVHKEFQRIDHIMARCKPVPIFYKSWIASREWLAGAQAWTTFPVEYLDQELRAVGTRAPEIVEMRRVTRLFRAEGWLLAVPGLAFTVTGIAGWPPGQALAWGSLGLMGSAYLAHTGKAMALGSP